MKSFSFPSALVLMLGLSSLAVSCKSRNAQQPAPAPAAVPPAQYGQPPAEGIPAPPAGQAGPGGRFGYTGANPAPGGAPAAAPGTTPQAPAPAPAPGMRDVRDIGAGSVKPPATDGKPTPPPASTAPSSADMAYANAVPGNPLVVTLPGANASLGQISVEKYDSSGNPTGEPLKKGTQVQIPDPNNPGKKIYFKVP